MGWSSGTTLMGEIIDAVQSKVKDKKLRKSLYLSIISAFENADWDGQDECEGIDDAFDKALKELHPDWYKN